MPKYTAQVTFAILMDYDGIEGITAKISQLGQHELLIEAPTLEHAKAAILDRYNNYGFHTNDPNYVGLVNVYVSEHPNPAGPEMYPWTDIIFVE